MIHKEGKTELGSIKIYNEVLGSIASLAACEVEGVAKTAGGFAKSIYDFISRKQLHKGVRVETLNNNELKITVYVIVEYGVNIPNVAMQVQDNVRKAIEKMTGLSLNEVDVSIQGVIMPSKNQKPQKTEVKNEDTK